MFVGLSTSTLAHTFSLHEAEERHRRQHKGEGGDGVGDTAHHAYSVYNVHSSAVLVRSQRRGGVVMHDTDRQGARKISRSRATCYSM